MIRRAFGDAAARIVERIEGAATIVGCEPAFAGAALAAALDLRRAGRHFFATIVCEDERDRLARECSRRLCATYQTWDEIRLMFHEFTDALPAAAPASLTDADRESLRTFVRLSEGLIVRSIAEYERIDALLGPLANEVDTIVNDVPAPAVTPAEPADIVVYAPLERADALGAFITALGDCALPVTVVARDRPRLPSALHFVPPVEAGAALARARVIVDACGTDPGCARMLARFGRPLAVNSRGGAIEVLHGVTTYEAWNRASILRAVADALGSGPPRLRARQPGREPAPRPAVDRSEPHAPLVSVVVTTYDRPVLLAQTLATIERQTYPNLEIIVVNDAGPDVAGVVAAAPRARVIDHATNRGPAAGRNTGLRAASGEFVIFFDDDDEMFPEHVGALAGALARSGLEVAYGQMINGIAALQADGRYALNGVLTHSALLDHTEIQWGGNLATTAIMFRRRVIDEIGFVDETLGANEDFEFWIRLAAGREWARVPNVTSLYFIRNDGTNRSNQNVVRRYFAAHEAIFHKHPSARPLVNAGRASMLEYFRTNTPT